MKIEPDKKHPLYEKFSKVWKRVVDFSEGQDAVKDRGTEYLPMMPSQAKALPMTGFNGKHRTLYDLYLEKATVWPGASKTLKAWAGILARKAPTIEANDEFINIFSIDGEDINTVALWAAKQVMQTGLAGLLVDFPENGERPFAAKYRAKDILNWEYSVNNGRKELVHLALVELWKNDKPVKVMHLNLSPVQDEVSEAFEIAYNTITYELKENEKKGESEWVETGRSVPLIDGRVFTYIPFVPITEDGQVIQLDYPMMTDVVNLNMAHYQNDANYRNVLTFAGNPTPCVSGLMKPDNEANVTLGSTNILEFEENGSWGMLGLDDSSGINAIRQAAQDLQADMAVAGSRALMNDPNGVEAAETAMIHREGEHGQLSTIANVVSRGISAVLQIMDEWAGIGGDSVYELSTDFNPAKIDPQTLNTLWQMYMNGDISFDLLWYNMQRGELTPDLRTAEEEKEAATQERRERQPQNTVDLDNV